MRCDLRHFEKPALSVTFSLFMFKFVYDFFCFCHHTWSAAFGFLLQFPTGAPRQPQRNSQVNSEAPQWNNRRAAEDPLRKSRGRTRSSTPVVSGVWGRFQMWNPGSSASCLQEPPLSLQEVQSSKGTKTIRTLWTSSIRIDLTGRLYAGSEHFWGDVVF